MTDRGLSGLVGLMLLIGLVAIGSVGILVVGASVTDQTKEHAESERVQMAFLEFDQTTESVAQSENERRTLDFNLPEKHGGAVRTDDAGQIVITQTDTANGTERTLIDRSLGALVYEGESTTYAYQAGGVWRVDGDVARMVSAPGFSYATTDEGTRPTLTIPLTSLDGDRVLAPEQVSIDKNRTISPLLNDSVVEGELVEVRVQSDYYQGWAQYFNSSMTGAAVTVDHENETTILEMVVPVRAPAVDSGVVAGAAQGTLKLKQEATVDSYNSTIGSYSTSKDNGSKIVAAGDVELQQDSQVAGNLMAGKDVVFKQNATVEGNLQYENDSTVSYHDSPDEHVEGWVADNASIGDRTSVDGVIARNIGLAREDNDNDVATNISSNSLGDCDTSSGKACVVKSGTYLLDNIDLEDDEKLILDTSAGDIKLSVLDYVELYNGQIEVVGDNRVDVYLGGESGNEDFSMKQDSEISVKDDRSPGFWLYMVPDAQAKLRQNASFTGVIYGPGRSNKAGAHIAMSSNTGGIDVMGAVIGDVDPITQEVQVHYDEALLGAEAVRTTIAVPRLTFLHVSVNEVTLENTS